MGITGQSLDYFLQYPQINLGDLKDKKGVVVASVFDDNDLLKKGDLITAIDGNEVTDMISLKKQLLNYKVGDSAKITVYRDGKTMDIDFTFTLDSSKVDQYKQANPDNKIENNDKKDRGSNPFFDLP